MRQCVALAAQRRIWRSNTKAPAPRATDAVASIQLSATTTTRKLSRGQSIANKLETVRTIPASSLCAGTITSKLSCRDDGPNNGSFQDRTVSSPRYAQENIAGNARATRKRIANSLTVHPSMTTNLYHATRCGELVGSKANSAAQDHDRLTLSGPAFRAGLNALTVKIERSGCIG